MDTKCPCQHCNEPLIFESQYAGQLADCPHCGGETLLFIPPAGQTMAALFSETPRSVIAPGFEMSEGIMKILGTSYPYKSIVCVKIIKLPVDRSGSKALYIICCVIIALGFFGVLLSAGEHGESDHTTVGYYIILFGIAAAIGVGILELKYLPKPKFAFSITTLAGDKIAAVSESFDEMNAMQIRVERILSGSNG